MKKMEQIYEGKAKKVFATDDPKIVIVDYKDDATAFNGLKKGTIAGKGVVNNKVSNHFFRLLESRGIPTHYVEQLSDRETAVRRVEILPVEVIVRNRAAGSFSKRMGVAEGTDLACPILEYSYKNDELGDPFINSYYIRALNIATDEEMEQVKIYSFQINDILKSYLDGFGIELIDFKVRILDSMQGTDATIRVLIETTDGIRSWSTVGVGSDVVAASWEALADSITWGLLHHELASGQGAV